VSNVAVCCASQRIRASSSLSLSVAIAKMKQKESLPPQRRVVPDSALPQGSSTDMGQQQQQGYCPGNSSCVILHRDIYLVAAFLAGQRSCFCSVHPQCTKPVSLCPKSAWTGNRERTA